MKHVKQWEEGNLLDSDLFDGNTKYNSIELNDNEDVIYGPDLARPLKNIYDTVENIDYIINKITSTIGIRPGVYPNSFNLSEKDIKSVVIRDSSNNIVRKHFIRVSPGVIYNNDKNIPIYPTISIAERQLHKILELDKSDLEEKVKINYYENTDRFDIQVKKKDSSKTLQTYNYSEGTYGDSTAGYDTGLDALVAVYNDFSIFRDTVNENIESIKLENIVLFDRSSVGNGYIGFNENYELVFSTQRPYISLHYVSLLIGSSTNRLFSFQNLDQRAMVEAGGISSGGNRVRNITGDTLSINVIQSDGDSKVFLSGRFVGDILNFNYIYNSRFINLTGDTISVNTVELDNFNEDINLLSKLIGDTIDLNTLRAENILGGASEVIPSRRRDRVVNTNSGVTVSRSDEGKIFNITSSNNRTINLPNINSNDNGFTITIRKEQSFNNITINPNGSDTINGNSNYLLTEKAEVITIKWNGNEWIILSYFIGGDVLPMSKGGFGVDNESSIFSTFFTFTEEQADNQFALKGHIHSDYLTSVPSVYLTESEGDGRYYIRSQVDSRINTQENNVKGSAPSNLDDLNALASAIDDNPNFYDDIIDDVNDVINQTSGDSLYRQDVIYSGDTVVSYNGDTREYYCKFF